METAALEFEIINTLIEKSLTITAAESCTGGMICASLVNVPGASDVFREGFVTYSNEAKMRTLGVSSETIEAYTEVSEQCAMEMASGAAGKTGADIALSTTGYAGPGGKDVGLVYIGLFSRIDGEEKCMAKRMHFTGNRMEIRNAATACALAMAADCLKAAEE